MPRGQCRLETKGILVMQQSAERTQLSPDGEGVMLARELEVAERIRGGSGLFSIRQMASIQK